MRSKNASKRRRMNEKLLSLQGHLSILKNWWTCSSYEYEMSTSTRRERQQHEYPENQEEYWAATYYRLGDMMNEIQAMRKFALESLKALEAEKRAEKAD